MLMFDSSRLYNPDKTQFSLTGGLKFIGEGIEAVVQPTHTPPLEIKKIRFIQKPFLCIRTIFFQFYQRNKMTYFKLLNAL